LYIARNSALSAESQPIAVAHSYVAIAHHNQELFDQAWNISCEVNKGNRFGRKK
jgi:hypothetical protein